MSFDIRLRKTLGKLVFDQRVDSAPGLTAIIGTSGIGKTSLLNMVAGLMRPDEGSIRVGGRLLFDSAARIDVPPAQRRCGYIFQDARLFPHMNVRSNLLYGHKRAQDGRHLMTLEEATGFLGIDHLLDRKPATLSGGEAQRVAIGRALLSGPDFLLMDEPLSSLDTMRRQGIIDVILRIRDDLGLPILYVTHDEREVDQLATTRIELDQPTPL